MTTQDKIFLSVAAAIFLLGVGLLISVWVSVRRSAAGQEGV